VKSSNPFRNAGVSKASGGQNWNSNFAPNGGGDNFGLSEVNISTNPQPPQSYAASLCRISRQWANVGLLTI